MRIDGRERVVGALIEVVFGTQVQLRQYGPGAGFGVQDPATIHVGTGPYTTVDVRVFAPGALEPTAVFSGRPTQRDGDVIDILEVSTDGP